MKGRLVLWLVMDGKPGHENQSLGLAEALGRRVGCEVCRISLVGKKGVLGRVRAAVAGSAGFPEPDVVMGAGHATHGAILWLARRHGARSVVLMKPSLPLGWFDAVIAPEHDFPSGAAGGNVIVTKGALNRVRAGGGERSGKLVLIGGPSKTHGWDGGAVLEMLAKATDRGGWELTDSRRTPEGFLEEAAARLPGVECVSHRDTPDDWVPEKLAVAKEVWVTEDSVSMVYEALAGGARVGLLPVPRLRGASRVLAGVDRLVEEGYVTPFPAWEGSHRLKEPPEVLAEAERCAGELLGGILA